MKSTFTLLIFGLLSHLSANCNPKKLSPSSADFAQLRSNLYIVPPAGGDPVLMDGNLVQYDSSYSNELDGMDARKMSNPSENWGMLRGATTLVIERRHSIEKADSIFFKMWNMRIITYQIEIITANLDKNKRVGYLEDAYLKSSVMLDLNGTTRVNFAVTSDPASKASNRFRIVFSTPEPEVILPVIFISTKAVQQQKSVSIDWKTVNEKRVKIYNVEKSLDGKRFEKASELKKGDLNYTWTDVNPGQGDNYYRIRTVEIDDVSHVSDIMKVYVAKGNQRYNVFPNPATAGNLNLQFVNQNEGKYEIKLMNSFGQTIMTKSIQHSTGSSQVNVSPSQNLPKGIYKLEIKSPEGDKSVISVVF